MFAVQQTQRGAALHGTQGPLQLLSARYLQSNVRPMTRRLPPQICHEPPRQLFGRFGADCLGWTNTPCGFPAVINFVDEAICSDGDHLRMSARSTASKEAPALNIS
jgi:hypothetical protein